MLSEIDYQIWDGMSLTKLVVPIQAVHVLAFSISDAFVNSWYLYEVVYKRSGFKVFLPSDFHCGRLHWILINSFLDGTCDHSICFCLLRALWLLSRSRVEPTMQSVFLDDSSLSPMRTGYGPTCKTRLAGSLLHHTQYKVVLMSEYVCPR